ncbi:MAG TPA: hypothetical protein PKN50_09815 [Spirochaetota bacterium]|nr:hypothetical protein [Spirochaetota bacterium]HPV40973.1 hypothetical protein [Spirochaetota bacterium]
MKKVLMFIVMCATVIIITQSAQAAGIGVYGTGGVNFSTWNYKGASANSTDYFYGGGLVVDSNVARNELFGYRFTAGYEQYRLKDPDTDSTSSAMHRVSMSHTFGFGIARNETVRFWLGPRIGMHYLRYRDSYNTINMSMFPYVMPYPQNVKVTIDMIGIDALLAMGLNINMGDVATIFFDLGIGYMGNYNIRVSERGHGFGVDGKIGFMFRINDNYKLTSSTGNIKIEAQEIK